MNFKHIIVPCGLLSRIGYVWFISYLLNFSVLWKSILFETNKLKIFGGWGSFNHFAYFIATTLCYLQNYIANYSHSYVIREMLTTVFYFVINNGYHENIFVHY